MLWAREQPLDCASRFKCEGLGIRLFERIENDDPSALIRLPMILLARCLRSCNLAMPLRTDAQMDAPR